VKLTRFGPGVVLALFGAGLIVFGITRNFTASSTTKVTQALPSGGNMAVESSANLNAAYIETSNEISLAADANVLAGQNDAINNDSGDQAANEKR
jgi:hypothetical protein